MRVDVTLNTDHSETEVSLETTPSTPVRDIVSEACDDAGVDHREVTSWVIVGTSQSGEMV